MTRRTPAAWATLILALAFAVAPLVTSPFSGFASDQLPNPQPDPPVQPAGYAFSIWGLIYVWLILSALYGWRARGDDPEWERVRWPLIVSLAVGVPWLWIANQSAPWATVAILVMAAGAIAAALRAPIFDRWMLAHPVAVYAGWLTAASAVSLAVTLAGFGILLGPVGWAWLCLVAAIAIAVAVQVRGTSPAYGLTVIWALVAVVVSDGMTSSVGWLAIAGIVVMAATLGWARWRP
ncbi:hypothetical protein OG2516_04321 [Oceanicola granulosus HTCC2516]|uniref:Uncharacterized protein n=1 Tax=Oceanicola granulosus (strain ATCC BAA-861 / DSM 15982 / KCTC 12143 / HTCC2516) TaxID=314256 RepID=Q2CA55_OCEGH|nr:hypothetical protein [Oceanicola granulosus]EAR49557.1 hypothetical protein OG2516_04321 [Oceanicola granulosus HTCC2516]